MKKLRPLKLKGDAYYGTGMLVDCSDLGTQVLVIAPDHETMQRVSERLGMVKYDTKSATKLIIKQDTK